MLRHLLSELRVEKWTFLQIVFVIQNRSGDGYSHISLLMTLPNYANHDVCKYKWE